MRKNFGEAGDQLDALLSAAIRGDTAEVGRLSGDLMKLPVDIVVDAFPVLTTGAGALDAAGAAREKVRRRLEAAKRRVGRLVGAAGGTVADARAALAVDEDERDGTRPRPRSSPGRGFRP